MKKNPYKIILVTNRNKTPLSDYLDFIRICAESGITAVQLREKNVGADFLLEFGHSLKRILLPLNIPLIVNDSINLAVQLNADGVHLGQTDGNPCQARTILGEDKIIGLSIETVEEIYKSHNFSVSYVAASAIFPTQNKQNVKTLWGLDGLSNLVKLSKHPVVAIGGINPSNAEKVIETGVAGIAIIGALHNAKNPQAITRQLRQIIDETVMRGSL